MSLYLNVTFAAGEGLDYTQYDVAAFVGDECRGVAEVLPVPGGKDCLYLRARSNRESGETMTFRYRNTTTGEVKDIENVNFAFASNARLGYPSSPYEVKIVIYHDVIISTEGGGSVNESGGRLARVTLMMFESLMIFLLPQMRLRRCKNYEFPTKFRHSDELVTIL